MEGRERESNGTERIAEEIGLAETSGESGKQRRRSGALRISIDTNHVAGVIEILSDLLYRGHRQPLSPRSSTAPVTAANSATFTAEDPKVFTSALQRALAAFVTAVIWYSAWNRIDV